jgi:hypothetical protein
MATHGDFYDDETDDDTPDLDPRVVTFVTKFFAMLSSSLIDIATILNLTRWVLILLAVRET